MKLISYAYKFKGTVSLLNTSSRAKKYTNVLKTNTKISKQPENKIVQVANLVFLVNILTD